MYRYLDPRLQFCDFLREGEASVLERQAPEIRIPPARVLAGCISLASSYTQKLVHFAARPFPHEAGFAGTPSVRVLPRIIPILTRCFLIVALLTQWLPVVTIPEELHVAPMRNDMVHDLSTGILAVLLALST